MFSIKALCTLFVSTTTPVLYFKENQNVLQLIAEYDINGKLIIENEDTVQTLRTL